MKLEYGKKSDENVGSDLNYIYIYMLQLLVGTIMVIVPKKKFNQHMIAYIV